MKPQESITSAAYRAGKLPRPSPLTPAARKVAEATRATFEGSKRGHASDRYNAANRGRRADLGGKYFRSKGEANYARLLELMRERGEIDAWEFEAETFVFEAIRSGTRIYTPDFKIWPPLGGVPYFVEIKPWMDPKSKTKLARMAKYFPDIRVDVVDRAAMAEIAAKVGKLIPGWE